jgi:hypothetical protein
MKFLVLERSKKIYCRNKITLELKTSSVELMMNIFKRKHKGNCEKKDKKPISL